MRYSNKIITTIVLFFIFLNIINCYSTSQSHSHSSVNNNGKRSFSSSKSYSHTKKEQTVYPNPPTKGQQIDQKDPIKEHHSHSSHTSTNSNGGTTSSVTQCDDNGCKTYESVIGTNVPPQGKSFHSASKSINGVDYYYTNNNGVENLIIKGIDQNSLSAKDREFIKMEFRRSLGLDTITCSTVDDCEQQLSEPNVDIDQQQQQQQPISQDNQQEQEQQQPKGNLKDNDFKNGFLDDFQALKSEQNRFHKLLRGSKDIGFISDWFRTVGNHFNNILSSTIDLASSFSPSSINIQSDSDTDGDTIDKIKNNNNNNNNNIFKNYQEVISDSQSLENQLDLILEDLYQIDQQETLLKNRLIDISSIYELIETKMIRDNPTMEELVENEANRIYVLENRLKKLKSSLLTKKNVIEDLINKQKPLPPLHEDNNKNKDSTTNTKPKKSSNKPTVI